MEEKTVGIILIVMGVLSLLGVLWIGAQFLGVLALVVGIVMMLGKMEGGRTTGIILTIAGALLLLGAFDILSNAIERIVNVAAGVVLLVIGIMKVSAKN